MRPLPHAHTHAPHIECLTALARSHTARRPARTRPEEIRPKTGRAFERFSNREKTLLHLIFTETVTHWTGVVRFQTLLCCTHRKRMCFLAKGIESTRSQHHSTQSDGFSSVVPRPLGLEECKKSVCSHSHRYTHTHCYIFHPSCHHQHTGELNFVCEREREKIKIGRNSARKTAGKSSDS